MNKYFIILLVALSLACKEDNKIEFIDFFENTETFELKSHILKLQNDSLLFSKMFEMKYLDDIILVSDPSKNYTMKIVDLEKNRFYNFGKRGEGPNEMNSQISRFTVDYNKNLFYVNDNFKYYNYSVDSLKKGITSPNSYFDFSAENDGFIGSTTFCKGKIIGGMFNNKFGSYSIIDKTTKGKYKYPKTGGPLSNQSYFFAHPNKELVFYMQSKSAVLGIINVSNNDIEIEKELTWWVSNVKEVVDGNTRTTIPDKNPRIEFVSADVTNNYIYILYSGKTVNTASMEEAAKAFLSNTVYVMDWTGKPIKTYNLDQEVRSITVDENNNLIYAASYQGGEPNLIKFKM